MIQQVIKSPFLHFLLIGAGLFILYSWVGKNSLSNNENKIVITDDAMSQLVSGWNTQFNRLPDTTELLTLAQDYIKQEVYYREALKLHLDRNDEIVRRRLAQKMGFLSNDLSNDIKPTEADLEAYYAKYKEKYTPDFMYSFYQVCFSPDKRSNPKQDALALLAQLQNEPVEKAKGKGDITVFPFEYTNVSVDGLIPQLGSHFAHQLTQLEVGQWVGPITSAYGEHLVYLERKKKPPLRSFDQVKEQVSVDYQNQVQEQFSQSVYKEMRKNYTIDFELKDRELEHNLNAALNKE